ncbi:hypothetical protein AAY473_004722 [Plecturocebus cupreus]
MAAAQAPPVSVQERRRQQPEMISREARPNPFPASTGRSRNIRSAEGHAGAREASLGGLGGRTGGRGGAPCPRPAAAPRLVAWPATPAAPTDLRDLIVGPEAFVKGENRTSWHQVVPTSMLIEDIGFGSSFESFPLLSIGSKTKPQQPIFVYKTTFGGDFCVPGMVVCF